MPFKPRVVRAGKGKTRRTRTESPVARLARLERGRFYSSKAWRKISRAFLIENPTCCNPNCDKPAEIVDHIIPRLDDPGRAYDWENFRPFCRSCHSILGDKHKRRISE